MPRTRSDVSVRSIKTPCAAEYQNAASVSLSDGNNSGLSRMRAYISQAAASTMITARRRTRTMLVMRSNTVSGRATSPISPVTSGDSSRSGRSGGSGRLRSSMMGLASERGFDLIGEQQAVDAAAEQFERFRAEIGKAEMSGVQFGFDLTGMRRHDGNAVADQERFL